MLRIDLNLLWTILNLLLLFILVKIFLFNPVQKIIAARQEEVDKQLDDAKAAQTEADELKVKYADSLAGMEEERKKTLQDARKNADEEYKKIVSSAQAQAKQIKEEAVLQAESEKEQILKKAEQEIADMVVDAATKVVGSKSGVEIDRSLYDEFLDKAGE